MKTLISILIIYFLFISSQSLFAADVTPCPFSKFEGFGGVSFNEDGTLKKQKISKEYKKLTPSEKRYCDKQYEKRAKEKTKKRRLSEATYGLSNVNGKILGLILVGIIAGIIFFFVNVSTFFEYINRKKKNKNTSYIDILDRKMGSDKTKPKQEEKPETIEKKKEQQRLEEAQSKIPKPISRQKKEEAKEILTWDEPAKPELKKTEPVTEEPKPTEVTITSQEEEEIYLQVAKELKENRSEGVWLKAYTENDGDETKTKIAYTKKRVATLMEELKEKKLK